MYISIYLYRLYMVKVLKVLSLKCSKLSINNRASCVLEMEQTGTTAL